MGGPQGIPLHVGEKAPRREVEDHRRVWEMRRHDPPRASMAAAKCAVGDHGLIASRGGNELNGIKEGKIHLHLTGTKIAREWALVNEKAPRGKINGSHHGPATISGNRQQKWRISPRPPGPRWGKSGTSAKVCGTRSPRKSQRKQTWARNS